MPRFIHERAKHILAKNPDMPVSEAFGIATNQSHALGKTPKGYGTAEGRHKAKTKYKRPKTMETRANPGGLKTEKLADALAKFAFVEALPVITGLASGYGPGRNIAGETAAAAAPKGRIHRSENIARNAAAVGVPLGGLAAMALAHKYRIAPRMADFAAQHFPGGLISDPESERELIRQLLPGAAAIGGSLAGGAATGGIVGGLQRLRGPTGHHEKVAASPMWSRIGGASSKKPLWMAQSGFTPTGFKTPAQRLGKSMSMGKVDGSKGLKPIDYGKMQKATEAASTKGSSSSSSALAQSIKMGQVMLAITRVATGQSIPLVKQADLPRLPAEIPGESQADAFKVLGGYAGMHAGAMGNEALISSLGKKVREEARADTGGALMKRVQESSPVPVIDVGSFPGNPSAYASANTTGLEQLYAANPQIKVPEGFKPLSPHVLLGEHRSPSVLAHEIGHADWDTNRVGRTLQDPRLARVLNRAKLPGAIALGAAGGFSDDPRVQGAALAGGVALHAPVLINEATANIKAYQRLKRLGASAAELGRARGSLGRAMGTYGTAALVPMGIGLMGQGVVHAARHSFDEVNPKTRTKTKTADDGGNGGFSTNQYSGAMNPPAMKYTSGIPPWKEPPVKTAGPPSEKTAAGLPTPLGRLASSKAIGAPRVTVAPGPSIAQIAKPKGFGTPMSGAKKGNNII